MKKKNLLSFIKEIMKIYIKKIEKKIKPPIGGTFDL